MRAAARKEQQEHEARVERNQRSSDDQNRANDSRKLRVG
jgi:hypothetical protein